MKEVGSRALRGAGGEDGAADRKRGVPGEGLGAGPCVEAGRLGRLRHWPAVRVAEAAAGVWRLCGASCPAVLGAWPRATVHLVSPEQGRDFLEGRDGTRWGQSEWGWGAVPVILSSSLR